MTKHPQIQLHNGLSMPQLGLGVWQASNHGEVEQAIQWALEAGYRSIDTAMIYGNEAGVGQALKASALPREDIFVTTKLWNEDLRQRNARQAFADSLQRLGLDYVDLYLIHWPAGAYVEAWKILEELYEAGKIKAIGVSNFMPEHLDTLMASASITPMVNQIEYHPYLQQRPTVEVCQAEGIVVEAWSPLMQGHFLQVPLFKEIGDKYGKSPAQVILRWNLQKGVVTIPKSTNQGRIQQNIDLFDFELSDAEMAQINGLERNQRFGPDPYNFDF